ncbi:uncharacterized protein J8A68_000532 [[Candida] subhashii]|uniref:Ammonia transport outward protein 2 n=1 Tax=[Candida] subhashii TaxID=561895 RepID=A0A8J5QHT2_9ASCO|nr:uncharacterized protein J8A68_000532 [[Candida] subhashii]KAG7665909.1 hypothetical protein J8A68_000532 [[Candida] subhashii]
MTNPYDTASSNDQGISLDDKTSVSTGDVVTRSCIIAGDGNEFVVLGNHKFYRHELLTAMATANQVSTESEHKYGNAAMLGVFSTSFNIMILGLYFATGTAITNAMVGGFFFIGGLLQFLSGAWCFVSRDTFGYTVFCSYGAFWMSFGAIFTPGFGILEAYADDLEMMNQAIGLMSVGWVIVTTMFLLLVLKTTWSFFWCILSLDVTIALLATGFLTGNQNIIKAGGIMGVINSFSGWIECYGAMANKHNSYFQIPAFPIPTFGRQKQH